MTKNLFETVLNRYLAWQYSKHILRPTLDENPPLAQLEQGLQDAEEWFDAEYSLESKLELIRMRHRNRANLFSNCTWRTEEYPVADLGNVLPKTGDLPCEVITHNLLSVSEFVAEELQSGRSRYNSVIGIGRYIQIADLFKRYAPIIIEPSNLQRHETKLPPGHSELEITPTRGYIEDGNHRALALVLETGENSIPCYVGKAPSGN